MQLSRSLIPVIFLLAADVAPLLAQSAPVRSQGITEGLPWLKDFIAAVVGIAMICILIYFFRPAGPGIADFSIEVDGHEVNFKGRFPEDARGPVEDFLVNDCQIEGSYEVIGKWHEGHLSIQVRGDNARPLEQRIRNFLKLNVKKAR